MIRLPRGTAQGLLAYEMEVQKRKDKLKEKIAKIWDNSSFGKRRFKQRKRYS